MTITKRLTQCAAVAFTGLVGLQPKLAVAGEEFFRPLQVVDSDGKAVGRLDFGDVWLRIDGHPIQVMLQRMPDHSSAGLTWSASYGDVYFKSMDCTGVGLWETVGNYEPFGTLPAYVDGQATLWIVSVQPPHLDAQSPLISSMVSPLS